MKNLLINFILLAPDGQGGGDPSAIDIDALGKLLSSRITAINEEDRPENNPVNPDRPRMLNYPTIDNSPINFAGYTDLQTVLEVASAQLKLERENNKKNGVVAPSRFIKASCFTDKHLITLRVFSVKSLRTDGYVTAEIWRKQKVHADLNNSGSMLYGKRVAEVKTETTAEPAKDQTKAPVKPAGV